MDASSTPSCNNCSLLKIYEGILKDKNDTITTMRAAALLVPPKIEIIEITINEKTLYLN